VKSRTVNKLDLDVFLPPILLFPVSYVLSQGTPAGLAGDSQAGLAPCPLSIRVAGEEEEAVGCLSPTPG
jgi:hypothetical protein